MGKCGPWQGIRPTLLCQDLPAAACSFIYFHLIQQPLSSRPSTWCYDKVFVCVFKLSVFAPFTTICNVILKYRHHLLIQFMVLKIRIPKCMYFRNWTLNINKKFLYRPFLLISCLGMDSKDRLVGKHSYTYIFIKFFGRIEIKLNLNNTIKIGKMVKFQTWSAQMVECMCEVGLPAGH